jgi:hypothetical protein
MSSHQLDILALEPYYGGVRRAMLESLMRCSRHRWTLFKLPARRMERRLSTAAHWFAETLARNWAGHFDVLLTSEALNLADLYRFVPELLKRPSVVYFHDNQLPEAGKGRGSQFELVNLNSAAAATEIWFNSLYHLRTFLARASAMVGRMPEFAGRNPMPVLTAKAHIYSPPIGMPPLPKGVTADSFARDRRTLLVDLDDSDMTLLNTTFASLARRGEPFKLYTLGSDAELKSDVPRTPIRERDEAGAHMAMLQAGVYLSAKSGCVCDYQSVRAMLSGCWPLCPQEGVYREVIPEQLQSGCLHNGTADTLTGRLQDAFHLEFVDDYQFLLVESLKRFDPMAACKAIDSRLEELAVGHSIGKR